MLLTKSYKRHIIHAVNTSKSVGRLFLLTICGKRVKQCSHEGEYIEVTCNECKTILNKQQ